jgi:hypothetical protein
MRRMERRRVVLKPPLRAPELRLAAIASERYKVK